MTLPPPATQFPQRPGNPQAQAGFALPLILGAIALTAILGVAYAVVNRDSNSATSSQQNKTLAAVVMQQGNSVKAGVDRVLTSGWALSEVAFNGAPRSTAYDFSGACLTSSGSYNAGGASCDSLMDTTVAGWQSQVFLPAAGGALPPMPQPDVLVKPTNTGPFFVYHQNFRITNADSSREVGTSAGDMVVALSGLKLTICRSINSTLYSDLETATPQNSGIALTAFNAPTAAQTLQSVAATVSARPEGCVATSDATPSYVYYKVLVPQ